MTFQEEISPLIEELFYPSESDEPVEHLFIETEQLLPFSIENLRLLLDANEEAPIEELDLNQFWEQVTVQKEWYGEEEIVRTKNFQELKTSLEKRLTAMQGFRVGEIEIELYIIGQTDEGKIEGIKTLSVET